jgi:hypothetical protein
MTPFKILLHTKPTTAEPVVINSVAHMFELNLFDVASAGRSDESTILYNYLMEHEGPFVVSGVDRLEHALKLYSNMSDIYVVSISQLTRQQIDTCVQIAEATRHHVMYMPYQRFDKQFCQEQS